MLKVLICLTFVFSFLCSSEIKIDGSSTVYPLSEAIAEEFGKVHPETKITIGVSGTGGGFKKFCVGETDINNASRHISETEKELAKKNKIKYVELKVAYDGIVVAVNPRNKFVVNLTLEELKRIWEPESKIKRWNEIRTGWPRRKINLYGPGPDSGTFDFFTEVVVGKAKASRADYTASEDDHILVTGVSGDVNALGYFGFPYYIENKKKLKAVAIDAGKGAIEPTHETISAGEYPLSRPLLKYFNRKSLKRPEVKKYLLFLLTFSDEILKEIGFVPMTTEEKTSIIKQLHKQRIITTSEMKECMDKIKK